jgi:hypothetical protein
MAAAMVGESRATFGKELIGSILVHEVCSGVNKYFVPIGSLSDNGEMGRPKKAPVQDDVIAVGHNDGVLVTQRIGRAPHEIKQAIATGLDMGTNEILLADRGFCSYLDIAQLLAICAGVKSGCGHNWEIVFNIRIKNH